MADQRAQVRQKSPAIFTDGDFENVRSDRTGAVFTADWKLSLLEEGRCFTAAFGAMGATDITELTAGSNLDQPDFGISVPSGTALIPLYINIAAKVPLDADDADAFFIVCVDTAAAYAGDGTVTAVTPINMISGDTAITTAATVFEDASADITDPTVTDILMAAQQQIGMTTSGVALSNLNLVYDPALPRVLVGPAAIYGYGGGSDTVTWVGVAHWAEVPSTRFS